MTFFQFSSDKRPAEVVIIFRRETPRGLSSGLDVTNLEMSDFTLKKTHTEAGLVLLLGVIDRQRPQHCILLSNSRSGSQRKKRRRPFPGWQT